jgi:flavin reductase (DIM6/NTAB) family NADH-FMN oxidoreductase RutF
MDPAVKKTVLRLFSYGVYALTARHGDETSGMTATWLSQVSFEPPLVAVAVEADSHTRQVLEGSGAFAVNVLNSAQKDLAGQLGRSTAREPDKLGKLAWHPGPATGSPILEAALAWVECRLRGQMEAGDHVIYVAEVVEAGVKSEGVPLTLRDTGFRYAG